MPRQSTLEVGTLGEEAALRVYRDAGYRLLVRNWRCRLGEIDLVLLGQQKIVFCEVKARRGDGLGHPFEAVDWKKQKKLRALAQVFMADPRLRVGAAGSLRVRFDVASVKIDRRGDTSVRLFVDAF